MPVQTAEALAFGIAQDQLDTHEEDPAETNKEIELPDGRRPIYVVEFEENVRIVLEGESKLFYQNQLEVFQRFEGLSEKGRYLFVRICGRKDTWHRVSNLKYYSEIGDVGKVMDELCGRPSKNTTRSPAERSSTVAGPSQMRDGLEVIDLTLDSDNKKEEPPLEPEGPRQYQFARDENDMSLQELLECANLEELKQLAKIYKLKVKVRRDDIIDELLGQAGHQKAFGIGAYFHRAQTTTKAWVETLEKRLCKMLGKCIRLVKGIIPLMQRLDVVCYRSTQWESGIMKASMLARFQKRNPVPRIIQRSQNIWTSPEDLDEYMTALKLSSVMDTLLDGKTEVDTALLEEGADIVELKTPVRRVSIAERIYTPGPGNARTPTPAKRTSKTPMSAGKRKRVDDEDEDLEPDEIPKKRVTEKMKKAREAKVLFEYRIYPRWKELMEKDKEEEEVVKLEGEDENEVKPEPTDGPPVVFNGTIERRAALQRFHPLYIYTRLVEKGAKAIGLLHEYKEEFRLINELLAQTKWRHARRGKWHERRALIAMTHLGKKAPVKRDALDGVVDALQDPHTHLIFLPKLVGRLTKLEKQLGILEEERHSQDVKPKVWMEKTFQGTRVVARTANVTLDATGRVKPVGTLDSIFLRGAEREAEPSRHTGKSIWKGRSGDEINVEALAIEHYEEDGYIGLHSEGSIIRTLFGLLMFDIIYVACPGAFETRFQVAPMDLGLDTFYYAREEVIVKRLEELKAGRAREIIERVDDLCRADKTYCVGVRWDNFSREQLVEIVECIGGNGLAVICELLCRDYRARGSGVPDLFIWHHEALRCKFVEVKGPGDTLSENQKLWIDVLNRAEIPVEVCHVEDRWADEATPNKSKGKGKATASGSKKKKAAPRDEDGFEGELDAGDELPVVVVTVGKPLKKKPKIRDITRTPKAEGS